MKTGCSVARIRGAGAEKIASLPGISVRSAQALLDHLRE
jgi:hypothetical protein